jgi:hypothetical protein
MSRIVGGFAVGHICASIPVNVIRASRTLTEVSHNAKARTQREMMTRCDEKNGRKSTAVCCVKVAVIKIS